MTPEDAQNIVTRVAKSHPKFKPLNVSRYGTHGATTFETPTVDPRRVAKWFEDEGCYVLQVGFNATKNEWYIYFRKDSK